jgi:hypothetical protein
MNSFSLSFGTWIILLVLCGCSNQAPTGKVTGEVTLDGQPIKDGAVMFIPADGQGQTGGAAIKEGKFVAEQVPIAKMKVEIHGNKLTGRKIKAYDTPDSPVSDEIVEAVPARYNFQTELTLDIKKGEQDVRYDLKSK